MATTRKATKKGSSVDTKKKPQDCRSQQWFVLEVQNEKGDGETYELVLKSAQGTIRNKKRILMVTNKKKPLRGVQLRTQTGTYLLDLENGLVERMAPELMEICKDTKRTKVKKQDAFVGKYKVQFLCFCVV